MHVSRDLFLIGGRGFQHHYYIQSFQCIHNVLKRQRIKAKLTPSECIFVRTAGTGGDFLAYFLVFHIRFPVLQVIT